MTEQLQALLNSLNLRLGYDDKITLSRDEYQELIENINGFDDEYIFCGN